MWPFAAMSASFAWPPSEAALPLLLEALEGLLVLLLVLEFMLSSLCINSTLFFFLLVSTSFLGGCAKEHSSDWTPDSAALFASKLIESSPCLPF